MIEHNFDIDRYRVLAVRKKKVQSSILLHILWEDFFCRKGIPRVDDVFMHSAWPLKIEMTVLKYLQQDKMERVKVG